MAERMLQNCKVLLGGYDFTGKHNSVNLNNACEQLDATVFGNAYRKRIPGLRDCSVGLTGFYDPETVDQFYFSRVGDSTATVITISPTSGIEGDVSFAHEGVWVDYNHGGMVGDMHVINAAAVNGSNNPLVRGKMLINTASTATATSTKYVDLGAIGSTQKLYCSYHITDISSGVNPTATVRVEASSSSGFGTSSTMIAFTASTKIEGQFVSTSPSTIMRWYRVQWTLANVASPGVQIYVSGAIK